MVKNSSAIIGANHYHLCCCWIVVVVVIALENRILEACHHMDALPLPVPTLGWWNHHHHEFCKLWQEPFTLYTCTSTSGMSVTWDYFYSIYIQCKSEPCNTAPDLPAMIIIFMKMINHDDDQLTNVRCAVYHKVQPVFTCRTLHRCQVSSTTLKSSL